MHLLRCCKVGHVVIKYAAESRSPVSSTFSVGSLPCGKYRILCAEFSLLVQNLSGVCSLVKPWFCSSEQNLCRKPMKNYSKKDSCTPNVVNGDCKAALPSLRTFVCWENRTELWVWNMLCRSHGTAEWSWAEGSALPAPAARRQMGLGWWTPWECVLLHCPELL